MHIYQIRVQGQLDPHWIDWFDGLTITIPKEGESLLSGPIPDQAALYGILLKIHRLGLSLVSLNQLELPGQVTSHIQ